ncbi:cyclase family protein [Candidatus Nitrosocosmicus sp. SS]|jgi:kynurenine formamidase|nr:cyclase family protein [Candidatus Nitrosocosmicus sp. SS]KAF0869803.1 cyclase family protein [Candidatus Nitrosocosmicus sp. SS]
MLNMTVKISEKIYDISHTISKDMTVYPGDPEPDFMPYHTKENDNFNVTKIIMGSHTGTHIDAQTHFLNYGNSIDKEPLNKFIGECIIVDFSKKKKIGEGITDSDLKSYFESTKVKENDIILLYTGTSKDCYLGHMDTKHNFTFIEPPAARWIVDNKIKCVGIDTMSIEKYGTKDGVCHDILLSNGVGIIENLNSNLEELCGKRMFLVCLPLSFKGIDGSPSRAILFDIDY